MLTILLLWKIIQCIYTYMILLPISLPSPCLEQHHPKNFSPQGGCLAKSSRDPSGHKLSERERERALLDGTMVGLALYVVAKWKSHRAEISKGTWNNQSSIKAFLTTVGDGKREQL